MDKEKYIKLIDEIGDDNLVYCIETARDEFELLDLVIRLCLIRQRAIQELHETLDAFDDFKEADMLIRMMNLND